MSANEEYTPSLQDMRNAFALYYVHGNIYEPGTQEWRDCLAWAEAAFDRGFVKEIRSRQDDRLDLVDRLSVAEAKLAQVKEILEDWGIKHDIT